MSWFVISCFAHALRHAAVRYLLLTIIMDLPTYVPFTHTFQTGCLLWSLPPLTCKHSAFLYMPATWCSAWPSSSMGLLYSSSHSILDYLRTFLLHLQQHSLPASPHLLSVSSPGWILLPLIFLDFGIPLPSLTLPAPHCLLLCPVPVGPDLD